MELVVTERGPNKGAAAGAAASLRTSTGKFRLSRLHFWLALSAPVAELCTLGPNERGYYSVDRSRALGILDLCGMEAWSIREGRRWSDAGGSRHGTYEFCRDLHPPA